MVSHDGERQPWRVRALRRLRGLDGQARVEPARPAAGAPAYPPGGGPTSDEEIADGEIVEEARAAAPSEPPRAAASSQPPSAPPPQPRGPSGTDPAAERRRRRFRAVIRETYPSVAEHLIALAEGGPDADLDDWLEMARLLSDDLRHRSGGLSAEARSRALEQTVAAAIEAQARSSARLAGYADDVHDDPSPFDGDAAGTTIWEHYICPEARLALQSLHGEALGNWLDALSELWEAANAVYVSSVARADSSDARGPTAPTAGAPAPEARPAPVVPPVAALPPAADDGAPAALPAVLAVSPSPPLDRPEQARIRLKTALVKVEELSLW